MLMNLKEILSKQGYKILAHLNKVKILTYTLVQQILINKYAKFEFILDRQIEYVHKPWNGLKHIA